MSLNPRRSILDLSPELLYEIAEYLAAPIFKKPHRCTALTGVDRETVVKITLADLKLLCSYGEALPVLRPYLNKIFEKFYILADLCNVSSCGTAWLTPGSDKEDINAMKAFRKVTEKVVIHSNSSLKMFDVYRHSERYKSIESVHITETNGLSKATELDCNSTRSKLRAVDKVLQRLAFVARVRKSFESEGTRLAVGMRWMIWISLNTALRIYGVGFLQWSQMVPEFYCCVDADGVVSLGVLATGIPGRIARRFIRRLRKTLLEKNGIAGLILKS